MRKLFFLLIIAAILLLIATAAGGFAADGPRDLARYDVNAERVYVGAVHDRPSEFEGRMYFTLWTSNGIVAVEIGPKDFVEHSGFKFAAHQMVTVVGMPVVIGNRNMVLAREIMMTGAVFVVRDRNGQPKWDPDVPVQMDPELGWTSIPIC
jgi:hypothetical protein